MGEVLEPPEEPEGAGLKVELLDRVEDGWTGPRERRDAAKSGSEASRDIASKVSAKPW